MKDEKGNNTIDNLEWSTPSDNQKHAYKTGLKVIKTGEQHHMCKLSENDVIEIKRRLKNNSRGLSSILAKQFNVHITTISAIKHKRIWSHIQ